MEIEQTKITQMNFSRQPNTIDYQITRQPKWHSHQNIKLRLNLTYKFTK